MPLPNQTQLSDLRGTAQVAVDAVQGIADLVEDMHRTIQLLPGPLGPANTQRTRGITGLVYRSVRGIAGLVGKGMDLGLAPLDEWLPDGLSSPGQDAFRSAINGICGDYLARTQNPLALDMTLRFQGRPVDIEKPLALVNGAQVPGKIVVFVHGLCLNDSHWERDGHNHGSRLSEDLGCLSLYLRYNTGLSIAENGRELAGVLERLFSEWISPSTELDIVGHSMGGLVARSACHQAQQLGHDWPRRHKRLVFLGTPHQGTPLDRAGHGLDALLSVSPYLAPFMRLGSARSQGIMDLRHGVVTSSGRTHVPLPRNVCSYTVAALKAADSSTLSKRFVGDGLVPLNSALGRHRDARRSLVIPKERQFISHQTGHLQILSNEKVYRRLSVWLDQPA